MDRPLPWLRYVGAADLGESDVDFDGMNVHSAAGEKLGKVDGFIVDADSGRPYYVVVDSGGWFRSKHYLIPVGHASVDPERQQLVADLGRDRIERFPGFDKDQFEKLSAEEIEQLDRGTAAACCPTEAVADGPNSWADRWEHYTLPDWWNSNCYRPDRAGGAGLTAGAEWSRETCRHDAKAIARDASRR
jgi:PRC-barrel domain